VGADGSRHVADLRDLRQLEDGPVDLDDVGELGDVDEGVAERPRHLLVDEGDDRPGPSAAALVHSMPTPNEQKPCSSGGEMWMIATSTAVSLGEQAGIIDRWTGRSPLGRR